MVEDNRMEVTLKMPIEILEYLDKLSLASGVSQSDIANVLLAMTLIRAKS